MNLLSLLSTNMANTHSSINVANAKFYKQTRRHNYTTPKSFLELIDFYIQVLEKKRQGIFYNINRYEQGLTILAETQSKVEGL